MISVSPAMHQAGTIPEACLVPPWRVIGCFNTIEEAQLLLHRLHSHGIEACLSLIGGLSVLVQSDCSDAVTTTMLKLDRRTQTDHDRSTSYTGQ